MIWTVNSQNVQKAIEVAKTLERIHKDNNIRVLTGYDDTFIGALGELEYDRQLTIQGVDRLYLNDVLNEDGSGDSGDMVVEGVLYNVKT